MFRVNAVVQRQEVDFLIDNCSSLGNKFQTMILIVTRINQI